MKDTEILYVGEFHSVYSVILKITAFLKKKRPSAGKVYFNSDLKTMLCSNFH